MPCPLSAARTLCFCARTACRTAGGEVFLLSFAAAGLRLGDLLATEVRGRIVLRASAFARSTPGASRLPLSTDFAACAEGAIFACATRTPADNPLKSFELKVPNAKIVMKRTKGPAVNCFTMISLMKDAPGSRNRRAGDAPLLVRLQCQKRGLATRCADIRSVPPFREGNSRV